MSLLDTNTEFDAEVFRNIVSLRTSTNLFDDVSEDEGEQEAGNDGEMAVRFSHGISLIDRGFAYSAAIDYPFHADHLAQGRYSDGSFPVWYGALDEDTAIHETAWHALEQIRDARVDTGPVRRERMVWRVHAAGVFVDLTRKQADLPDLVGEHYVATQAIAKRLQEHHPGLVAPSARREGGACLVAFTKDVLSAPKVAYYLTYLIDADRGVVTVERQRGVRLTEITEAELHWFANRHTA